MKLPLKFEKHFWIDIPYLDFPESLLNKIEGRETYRDMIIKEHIYGTSLFEDLYQDGIVLSVQEDEFIAELVGIMNSLEIGYFRVVFS